MQNVDSLYLCLLRQIRGGDMSQPNLILCDQLLKLFELHKSWLDSNIKLIPTFVYTYLRVIADHQKTQLQSLQQKEIKFVLTLLKEKVNDSTMHFFFWLLNIHLVVGLL